MTEKAWPDDADGVEEVPIEEILCEDAEGLFPISAEELAVLQPEHDIPPPTKDAGDAPEKAPPARGRRGGADLGDADAEEDDKPSGILGLPRRIVGGLVGFVLGSGLGNRSALTVTIRLLALLFPLLIVFYMAYLTMGQYLGTGGDPAANAGTRQVMQAIGDKDRHIALPNGWTTVGLTALFSNAPLANEAAQLNESKILIAGRHADKKRARYYLTVAETRDALMTAVQFNAAQFQNALKTFINKKEFASTLKSGSGQVIGPFEEQPASVCYGRIMEKAGDDGTPAILRQYSCLMVVDGKPMIITAGYCAPAAEADGDAEQYCQTTLLAWRDQIATRK